MTVYIVDKETVTLSVDTAVDSLAPGVVRIEELLSTLCTWHNVWQNSTIFHYSSVGCFAVIKLRHFM